MGLNVSVPATRGLVGSAALVPTPWQSRPSSSAYDLSQVSLYLGWRRSWQWPRVSPVSLSRTGSASAVWAGLGTVRALAGLVVVARNCVATVCVLSSSLVARAAKAFVVCWVVCERVHCAIGSSVGGAVHRGRDRKKLNSGVKVG